MKKLLLLLGILLLGNAHHLNAQCYGTVNLDATVTSGTSSFSISTTFPNELVLISYDGWPGPGLGPVTVDGNPATFINSASTEGSGDAVVYGYIAPAVGSHAILCTETGYETSSSSFDYTLNFASSFYVTGSCASLSLNSITTTENTAFGSNSSFSCSDVITTITPNEMIYVNAECNTGSFSSFDLSLTGASETGTLHVGDGIDAAQGLTTAATAGTYAVSSFDPNGFYGGGIILVAIQPPPCSGLTISASASANEICFGESIGSASLSVTTGTSPYTYLWSDPGSQTTATATGLSAGTYTVTVQDSNTCTATASVVITQPVRFIYVSAGVVRNVTCNGNNNGSVTSVPVGGYSPYTYSWSPGGATTATASNLTAGVYTVTVTDNCGVSKTATASVVQPNAMRDSISSQTNLVCGGGNGGSLTLGCKGGTYPYNFHWSNSGTLQTITGLSAGTYTVLVTDQNGCTNTVSATITQPTTLAVALSSATYPLCHGGTGSATINVSGGTSPYVYTWSPNVSTTNSITNAAAGTYSVSVKDAHRCISSITVTITQPNTIHDSIVKGATVEISCKGSNTGSATVGAKYGTPPFTYTWTPNVGSTATVTGLSAGNYSVTVKDNNGCNGVMAVVTISQPALPLHDSVSVLGNVGCFGGSGGTVSIGTRGGSSPYAYAWSDGKTTYTVSGLTAGTYSVIIHDNNGCSNTITGITITQPAILFSTISYTCIGNSRGNISISASGGVAPYSFTWSNARTTTTLSAVTDGTYTVKVTDSHGCAETNSVTLTCPPEIKPPGKEGNEPPKSPPGCCPNLLDVNLYPNPNTGEFTITGLHAGMAVDIYDYTGRKVMTASTNDAMIQFNISDRPNGIYLIRIMDRDGTLVSQKKVVKTQ